MNKLSATLLFATIGLVAGYAIGISTRQQDANQHRDASIIQASPEYSELTIRYQSALTEANRVIDQLNDDIVTAQNIESLEELEAYIDTIPLRDTIAHPQID